MKINKWKVFQTIQLLLFIGISIFLFARSIDGSGEANTWNVKLTSFAVWLGFCNTYFQDNSDETVIYQEQ